MLPGFRQSLLILAVALALAACGVRGPLEAPAGAVADQPAAPGEPKPHVPFPLDPLL
jgi:predicted small lipoprotein YifL